MVCARDMKFNVMKAKSMLIKSCPFLSPVHETLSSTSLSSGTDFQISLLISPASRVWIRWTNIQYFGGSFLFCQGAVIIISLPRERSTV